MYKRRVNNDDSVKLQNLSVTSSWLSTKFQSVLPTELYILSSMFTKYGHDWGLLEGQLYESTRPRII